MEEASCIHLTPHLEEEFDDPNKCISFLLSPGQLKLTCHLSMIIFPTRLLSGVSGYQIVQIYFQNH